MDNYREIIAENLVRLRKEKKWTQIDIAEKLNYSNKAVSRWEKGEVIPDVDTLNKISELYGIELVSLFKVHEEKESITKPATFKMGNKLTISLLAVLTVWLCAVVMYVFLQIVFNVNCWQAFVWAVPISAIVGLVFNCIWGKRIWTFIIVSVLCWSILASFYFQTFKYNLWMVFIIGVPIQIGIILWANLRLHPKVEQDKNRVNIKEKKAKDVKGQGA